MRIKNKLEKKSHHWKQWWKWKETSESTSFPKLNILLVYKQGFFFRRHIYFNFIVSILQSTQIAIRNRFFSLLVERNFFLYTLRHTINTTWLMWIVFAPFFCLCFPVNFESLGLLDDVLHEIIFCSSSWSITSIHKNEKLSRKRFDINAMVNLNVKTSRFEP